MKLRCSRFLALAALINILTPGICLGQMYVGPYFGATFPHEAELEPTSLLSQDFGGASVTISDVDFDPDAVVGGKVGYWLEALDLPFLGLEAEVYGAFPKFSDQDVTVTISGPNGGYFNVPMEDTDIDVTTVGFNLLARYPTGPLQPYGGVGVGIVHADMKKAKIEPVWLTSIGGVPSAFRDGILFEDGDDVSPGLQVIGGVRGFFSEYAAVYVEYKWLKSEFEIRDIEVDYSASYVYGGIEFYLSPGFKWP